MKKYSVASLVIAMQPQEKTLSLQSAPYEIVSDREAEISISVSSAEILRLQHQNPKLSTDDCEYILTGAEFYNRLLDFEGLILHASGVVLDNNAYLFSAKSGIGKSTHASFWLKMFGSHAHIINDDKPALRIISHKFMVCGTPWSGKSALNTNEIVPLKAVAFIERGNNNEIRKLSAKEALPLLLEQTLRPADKADKLLSLADKLLTGISFYSLHCNMSIEAAECAYNGMKG